MKKTGSKRGSGSDAGPGSAVLDAPEQRYAFEADKGYPVEPETRASWKGRGPAPAGALQRGYSSGDFSGGDFEEPGTGYGAPEEPEYVPRRGGAFQLRGRSLPRTIAGRVALGAVVAGLFGVIAVALAAARFYALHDPRFILGTSDDIQIAGAQHLTRDQVLNVFGADLERNIFGVSLAERKADLERLPWVEHATVMRLLPNRIRVQINERTPVAFVRQGSQIGLVDTGGVLLDMPPDAAGDPQYSFPVLTGILSSDALTTRAARMEIYEQFMAELREPGEHLTDSLSEVDVSDPEDVKALIASGGLDFLVHFGNEHFLKRYRQFEQNLPEWKQQYPKLASADMRYDGQIVLEMQGGAAGAPDGDGSAAQATEVKDGSGSPAGGMEKANATALEISAAKPAGVKAAAANRALPKVVVKRAVARKLVAKRSTAGWSAAGASAANQREFAALAAAHRAALARAAKSGGASR